MSLLSHHHARTRAAIAAREAARRRACFVYWLGIGEAFLTLWAVGLGALAILALWSLR